jgi:hypothetical protein
LVAGTVVAVGLSMVADAVGTWALGVAVARDAAVVLVAITVAIAVGPVVGSVEAQATRTIRSATPTMPLDMLEMGSANDITAPIRFLTSDFCRKTGSL